MKKITLTIGACLIALMSFSQAFLSFNAPPSNGATTQVRAPNGTASHAFMRGVFYISASEMSATSPTASISSFGFNYANGVTGSPVTGSLSVYFQLTNDASNLKSTTYATAITGMSPVYNGSMSIPVSTSATFIDLPLTSAFNYTGSAMYIAYEWTCTGPFTASNTPATYDANNSIAGGGSTAASSSVAPTTLGSTSFRPSFRFGKPNTIANDLEILNIQTPALMPTVVGNTHSIKADVRNNSNVALTNVPVGLGMSGAITHTATAFIPSIAAGAITTVTFTPFAYLPNTSGVNSITVAVLPDDVNTNNIQTLSQTLNCNNNSVGPEITASTFTNGIGFNTSSGLLVNRMNFNSNTTINGVNVAIATGTSNVGNPTYAVLVDATGTVIATSNTITLAAGHLGTYTSYTFAASVPVTSGTDYFIGLAQTSNTVTGYFPVASNNTAGLIVPPMTLYSIVLTGGTPFAQPSSLGFLGFTAILDGSCVTTDVNTIHHNQSMGMALFPNPTSNSVMVDVNNVSENSTLEIMNTLGQSVLYLKSINEKNHINVSSLPMGVYFVTIKNGNQKNTQKLVIEK